ncbi:PGF-pre-PGF domain-containing protein [Candidatus Woesearchaeota archaeon]|nr:MAG: PGF-pre-PGF domain-containing protein [Candidatus Woesearchaeota archaeon]
MKKSLIFLMLLILSSAVLAVGPVTNLQAGTITNESIEWTWTNPSDPDYDHVVVEIDGQQKTSGDISTYIATGLSPETSYTITVYAVNTSGNKSSGVSDTQTTQANPDTTPPGTVSNLGETSVGTDFIYWAWTNPSDPDFDHVIIYLNDVEMTTTSSEVYHATGLNSSTTYTIKIHTVDSNNNVNTTDVTDSATTDAEPDTMPPASISGLAEQSTGEDWIYWAWTNPSDSDFDHVIIYIGNTNVANTSNSYYNATGLSPNTSYTIKIHTVDSNNNVNTTDVTDSATTQEESQGPIIDVLQIGGDDEAPYITEDPTPYLRVSTNVDANCTLSSNENFSFDSGTKFSTTGEKRHKYTFPELDEGEYTYYIICRSAQGIDSNVFELDFEIDLPPNISITNYLTSSDSDINESQSQEWPVIYSATEKTMTLSKVSLGFTKINFILNNDSNDVTVEVASLKNIPSSIKPIQRKTFKFIEVGTNNLDDSIIESAEVFFIVEREWLDSNNVSDDEIALFRYNNSQWNELPTEKLSAGTSYITYKATLPGFSFFAIAEKNISEEPCTENWSCSEWSNCSQEGIQTRICSDLNNCSTTINKPNETQSCEYSPPPTHNETLNKTNQTGSGQENKTNMKTDNTATQPQLCNYDNECVAPENSENCPFDCQENSGSGIGWAVWLIIVIGVLVLCVLAYIIYNKKSHGNSSENSKPASYEPPKGESVESMDIQKLREKLQKFKEEKMEDPDRLDSIEQK